jgi:hypothetical protein
MNIVGLILIGALVAGLLYTIVRMPQLLGQSRNSREVLTYRIVALIVLILSAITVAEGTDVIRSPFKPTYRDTAPYVAPVAPGAPPAGLAPAQPSYDKQAEETRRRMREQ